MERFRRQLPLLLLVPLLLLLPWPVLSQTRSEPSATATPATAGGRERPSIVRAASPRLGEEIRAVWFTSNDMDVLRDRQRMQEAVRQLAALHFNTIYVVVYNGGLVYYPSQVSQREGLQDFQYRGNDGQDILAELIDAAHSQGLLVLPWFEFGFMVPPGSVLTRRHPDWISRRRDGSLTSISAAGEVSWLNPLHPGVQTLLRNLILEIATSYDADGIQFDDHTTLPSDFGYDAFTAAAYKRSSKKDPPPDSSDPAWLKWRADGISAFMARLHQDLQEQRPGFLLSLSPNYYDFAYKRQLQDWLTWLRQGSIDEVVVQLYRPDLASFEAELSRPEFGISRQLVPTAIGILTGQRTAPVPIERVIAQSEAARRRQLGAAFFYYESLWDEAAETAELRRAGLASLFRQAAPRQLRRAAAVQAAPPASAPGAAAVDPDPPLPPTSPLPAPVRPAPPQPPQPAADPPDPAAPLDPPQPPPGPPPAAAQPPPAPLPPPELLPEVPFVDPSWGPWNGAIEEITPPP